jgi:hypothetical protein
MTGGGAKAAVLPGLGNLGEKGALLFVTRDARCVMRDA